MDKPVRQTQGKPKIIAVVGPTASGKSALGAYLARTLGGEIVSADSRQVYRGMRVISRALPTGRQAIQEHMVGVADPKRRYSAGQYAKAARKICSSILQNSKIPVVIGGTGFFIDSLTGRMTIPDVPPNPALRRALGKKSPAQLAAHLRRLDPARAAQVDPHNKVRLVRAIEIAKAERSGKSLEGGLRARRRENLSKFSAENLRTPEGLLAAEPYDVLWLGLGQPKNLRAGVEARLKAGMLAEAKALRARLGTKRYRELGFEFALLADYLDKKISKPELIDKIANGERKYAIRQMRWFKRNPEINWVANKSGALRLAKKFLSGR